MHFLDFTSTWLEPRSVLPTDTSTHTHTKKKPSGSGEVLNPDQNWEILPVPHKVPYNFLGILRKFSLCLFWALSLYEMTKI